MLQNLISYDYNLKESLFVEINPVQAVDASLVVMESSKIESENNSSENALSKSVNEISMQVQEEKVDMDTEDAGIKPVNDEEPMAELQLTVVYDVLANKQ
ncbi:hypothetical protein Tco_1015621 [Tanacetum coccineum]|uniref:Uncharacterized protein n=1 Tax=Tanacetum coccineum TaxID=301880 RepID=A0ABQ5FLF3_9ASTR